MLTSIPLRIILFVGVIGLALFDLRIAVVAQSSYSGVSRSKAVRKYQQQPRLLVAYGKQAVLGSGDLQAAEHWYQRALLANPFYIPAWLALSELKNDEGDPVQASAILEYADGLTRNVARWRWDKAMLAYQLNRLDILATDLSWLLQQEKVSGKTKKKAVKLAFSLWPEPDLLLDKMGIENIAPLFRHAIWTKNLTASGYLWTTVDKTAPAAKDVLPYINLLINSKEITTAARIWNKYFPADTLLYNGNFSNPIVNSGFGWRIGKRKGVEVEYNSGKNTPLGLHLHFTGSDNVNYYAPRQFIALPPGQSYVLSGQMRSSGLTTDQKPFVEVVGINCSMQTARTDMVQADQDWTSFNLPFIVPKPCDAVQVRIRRIPSNNLDNLIKGDLWLKDFSLRKSNQQPESNL